MGQVITQPRTGDTPGPGTRGEQRREDGQPVDQRRRGTDWRLVTVAVGIALAVAVAIMWFLGARDTSPGTVTTASDEAAVLADEKGAIVARGAVGAVTSGQEAADLADEKSTIVARGATGAITSGQEAATGQQEKEQLIGRHGSTAVMSTDADDSVLHDEKVELAARRTLAAPAAPAPLTEQAEKQLLLAR